MQSKHIHALLFEKEDASFSLKYVDNKLVDKDERFEVLIDGEGGVERRVAFTINWCQTHQANHSYDQVMFDVSDAPHDIRFRHFDFSISEDGLRVSISRIGNYVDSMIADSFESSLFDAISDAILITEADPYDLPGPKIVYCNKTFSEMTGYSAHEVLGRTPRMLQGDDTVLDARKHIRVGLSKWQKVKQKMINYRRDGSMFEVELNIAPVVDATGWYSHWISVQRELSAHKDIIDYFHRSEFILNASKTASWYFNFSKDSLFWDERMFQMHGMTPETGNITYLDWFACVYTEDRHPLYKSIENARHSQKELDISYRVTGNNNEIRWLRIRAEIMKDEQEMRILCGICFDITDEKASLEQIEKHRQKAEQSAKLASLGELAAGVGHEINNPLAVIVASIDLLELEIENANKLAGNVERPVQQMREASERIAKIVNGLRNVSSVAREFDQVSTANLSDDIDKTIQMLTDLYAADNVSVIFHPGDRDKSFIRVDPAGLQQVVVNLLSNAKDALLDQKAHRLGKQGQTAKQIEVIIENRKNTCCLHVKDNGTGIDEKIKDRIFEPFATMKDLGKGTGLGLSICKSIVESSGGHIHFKSDGTTGSCFTCEFIRVHPKTSEVTIDEASSSHAKVLIVEDDLPVAESLTSVLETFGCDVNHKQNGKEALEWLKDNDVDLLLTDLKMPVVDGWELLQLMEKRGLANHAQKFIMTGDVLSLSDKSQRNVGSLTQGVLQKPIRRIELARILNKLPERIC